jgi:plasmid stabilization system protein ParE
MRIRWTEPAARDLTHICDYIEERDARQRLGVWHSQSTEA